ncbi:MAG: hypothetical protein CMF74_07090 [Maricaulis sp.]|jgi:hypothetical protein|nr:hypothetical protein [Maricaulis sp.]HAQ35029.1 DUF2975 domain-containing protein [Alphaproteobacteria bacterium]
MTRTRRVSLVAILKWALDIAWYVLWALLVLTAIATAGMLGLALIDFVGLVPEALNRLPDWIGRYHGILLPLFVLEIIVLMIITDRLRRMFATLIAGDPFVPENAGHLRVIAVAIGVYQLVAYAAQGVLAMALTLFGQPVEGGVELSVNLDLNLGAWFAVVALLVLSEVFREGARMRQEQKLTI